MPDPDGVDTDHEWGELYNNGTITVDLYGWHLQDSEGGSLNYIISTSTLIEPGQYLAINLPGSALNNAAGDMLRLFLPDGKTMVDMVTYPAAVAGQSYSRDLDNIWAWTSQITYGSPNIFTAYATSTSISIESPTLTSTLSPTKTPSPTHTPSPTRTPSPTKTPSPTTEPTETRTPSPTAIPTETRTPTPTRTPTETRTPSPTSMPTETRTPTPTRTPSPTRVPTETRMPSPSRTPSPTRVPTETRTPSPTTGAISAQELNAITIVRFMANPATGQAEWVELNNQADHPIDVGGWKIDDSEPGNVFTLPTGSMIGAGETRQFTLPHAMLNNDGDTLRILEPGGGVATSIGFTTAAKGQPLCADGTQGAPCTTNTPTPTTPALHQSSQGSAAMAAATPSSTQNSQGGPATAAATPSSTQNSQGIVRKSGARPYGNALIGKRYLGMADTSEPAAPEEKRSIRRSTQALPKAPDTAPPGGLLILCLAIIAGCGISLARSYWQFSQGTNDSEQEELLP